MTHELTITHDERMLGLSWGVECSCGFHGAGETEMDAERIVATHKIWEEQKERLKEKGLLK